jgi:ATP-binding cassette subfamily B protein RaxB
VGAGAAFCLAGENLMLLNLSGKKTLPIVLQAESSECGLACIAMIASFYGYDCDLHSLRNKFGASSRGATLQNLMSLAESLNLTSRALTIELDELRSIHTPAILHWNFNHFVVLKKVGRSHIVIHDPAIGIRQYGWQEVSKRFTGVVLELSPRDTFETGTDKSTLKLADFWTGARGLVPAMVQIFALSLVVQAVALLAPFYIQTVVDEVLVKHDADLLVVLALGFAGVTLIAVVTKMIRGYAFIHLTNQLNFNVGSSLMHHLIRLPMAYFHGRHLGDVISRFGSLKPVQNFITGTTIAVVIDGLLATTTFSVMFIYSPMLTAIVLVSLLLYLLFRMAQFRILRSASHENLIANAKLDSVFMETIRSLQSIKLGGAEASRELLWRNQFTETVNSDARMGRLTVGYEAVSGSLTGFEYVLIVFLGAGYVLDGTMSIGMIYAFLAFRAHFSGAVNSIVNQFVEYLMIGLHLERLADITQSELEQGLSDGGTFIAPIDGRLELIDASFTYTGSTAPVFSQLNLFIPQGSSTAICGPSGIGKSTLLKVLMGLVYPTEGELQVDGQKLASLGLKSYRAAMGTVTQEDGLFSGSIRDNICFFDLSPDEDRIREVARMAEIHETVVQMPMAYESLIGDMGTALSVGQQQRLLLARALYRNPKIIFMDEGTAHLDESTELTIMSRIRELPGTCVYVTHNLELAKLADQVVFWDESAKIRVFDPSAAIAVNE